MEKSRTPKPASLTARRLVAAAKRRKTAKQHTEPAPTPVPTPKNNDWVAVAFNNGWYPGRVIDGNLPDGQVMVDYLHPATVPGQFRYPTPPDVTPTKPVFVFACPIKPSNTKIWRASVLLGQLPSTTAAVRVVQEKVQIQLNGKFGA